MGERNNIGLTGYGQIGTFGAYAGYNVAGNTVGGVFNGQTAPGMPYGYYAYAEYNISKAIAKKEFTNPDLWSSGVQPTFGTPTGTPVGTVTYSWDPIAGLGTLTVGLGWTDYFEAGLSVTGPTALGPNYVEPALDAVRVPRGGALVFPVTVRPDVSAIRVQGADVPLRPGMAVTVEVKTGKRRILEYLFSPLAQISSEAMGER